MGFQAVAALAGPLFSGLGEGVANAKRKGNAQTVEYQTDRLNDTFLPLRNQLTTGLMPGGVLRRYLAAQGATQALRGAADTYQTGANAAYRYGGLGMGQAGSFLDRSRTSGALGLVKAAMAGDASAIDMLSRMDASLRGEQAALPLEDTTNRWQGIGAGLTGFSNAYQQAEQQRLAKASATNPKPSSSGTEW